jgi:hypothetical protein
VNRQPGALSSALRRDLVCEPPHHDGQDRYREGSAAPDTVHGQCPPPKLLPRLGHLGCGNLATVTPPHRLDNGANGDLTPQKGDGRVGEVEDAIRPGRLGELSALIFKLSAFAPPSEGRRHNQP